MYSDELEMDELEMSLDLAQRGTTITTQVTVGEEVFVLPLITVKLYKGQKRFVVKYPSGTCRYTSLEVALSTMIQHEEAEGELPPGAWENLRDQI